MDKTPPFPIYKLKILNTDWHMSVQTSGGMQWFHISQIIYSFSFPHWKKNLRANQKKKNQDKMEILETPEWEIIQLNDGVFRYHFNEFHIYSWKMTWKKNIMSIQLYLEKIKQISILKD